MDGPGRISLGGDYLRVGMTLPLTSPVLLAVMLAAEKAELSREIPSRLFPVVSAEMLALLPFPVALRDYTLVTLGP